MNKELQDYAREKLKKGLANCTEGQQTMFKRMYAKGNLEKPINDVVDDIPADKLSWAMSQVQRTLDKKPQT